MRFTLTRFAPELETEYRQYYLASDIGQMYLGVTIWMVSFLGLVYADFLLMGQTSIFAAAVMIRLVYFGCCVVVLVALRRWVEDSGTFDVVALAWGLTTVLADVLITVLRPRSDISVLISDLVATFSFYVFLSNRTLIRSIPALLLSVIDLYIAIVYKDGFTGQIVISLVFSFTVTNLVGVVFSGFYFDVRRRQFLARREEDRVQAELVRLASTDPLTGVLNRRRLLELAGDTFYRFRRYNRPFSILVIDLDSFKQVNDTFGHQQGDSILISFTRMVDSEKRVADALGRMGGDEFCLVLPETQRDEARVVAGRILAGCSELVINDGYHEMQVTASIGITEASQGDASLDLLFARADTALYQAKAEGRNRFAAA